MTRICALLDTSTPTVDLPVKTWSGRSTYLPIDSTKTNDSDLPFSTQTTPLHIIFPSWATWAKIEDHLTEAFINAYQLVDDLFGVLAIIDKVFGKRKSVTIKLIESTESNGFTYLGVFVNLPRSQKDTVSSLVRCNAGLARILSSRALPLIVLSLG
jgi:hypothetical protein